MRRYIFILAASALLFAAMTGTSLAQLGQSVLRPPIGSISICPASWTTTFTSPTLGNFTLNSSATAQFRTTGVTGAGQPAGNRQQIISLNATASDPVLGTITWGLAPVAATTATQIVANQTGADFPATSNIYFTPRASISSQPGVTYTATREVHLQSTSLSSFPQQNESYTLVGGPIDFADQNGEVVFSIDLTNFVVN